MLDKIETITPNNYRSHTCGELSATEVGQQVRLSGWVHTRRDHGGLIFIDLRDKWGVTQLTFDPGKHQEAWKLAEQLRSEYVISIQGLVRERPSAMINDKLATGAVEVEVEALEVQSAAATPPFPIASDTEVNEELRLQYRFLDLRHPRRQHIMRTRDDFITHIRSYMRARAFTEVQTPLLANSSPEGARDYLVPSRTHPGEFYALPQSPQQFKQLLMVGGLDRYFQIAPCLRDEDPRADRHAGAFYQLDLEMSYVTQEDVFALVEPLMVELTQTFSTKQIVTTPFPRITWREAVGKYGSDKPDIRYDLFISDVSELVRQCEFKVFTDVLSDAGVVLALHVPGGATFSRSQIEELTEVAAIHGGKGLAYLNYRDEIVSPILKYLGETTGRAIMEQVGGKPGDAVFFAVGQWESAAKILGAVRVAAAQKLSLVDNTKAAWVWVTDFPMYERDAVTGKIDFSHNPFSMPQGGLDALNVADPLTILGQQYDLVLNGLEVSSGAIRNHRPDIMYRAFELAGYSKEAVDAKFGGMIRALGYGAPPHGGAAPGLDRLLMLLLDEPNIREMYAFPLDSKARDVMMHAPSLVSPAQLAELHLTITNNND